MTSRFSGKTVVVTGAASGIGAETVQVFRDEGASVVALDVSYRGTRHVFPTRASDLLVLYADVTDRASVGSAVDTALERFGSIDVLVNAAGVASRNPFMEVTDDEWDRVMNVNLRGTFITGQVCARPMINQGGGSIVNVASIAAKLARRKQQNVYSASKAGVVGLTKGMAVGLAEWNIRVNAVGPGPIETAMTQGVLDTPDGRDQLSRGVLLGRLGKVSDVANAVAFLASSEAEFIVGTTLYVDGGVLVGSDS